MATTLGSFLSRARTLITALRPQTGTTRFRSVDGLLPLESEPVVSDRLFHVVTTEGGELGPLMDAALVEYVTPIEIRVRYDHKGSALTGLDRVLEDAASIRGKLLQRPSWGAARVQLVTFTGMSREPSPSGSHFEDLVLGFVVHAIEDLSS
jgi:hypothetical protein